VAALTDDDDQPRASQPLEPGLLVQLHWEAQEPGKPRDGHLVKLIGGLLRDSHALAMLVERRAGLSSEPGDSLPGGAADRLAPPG
jgi:hypothetical protein